MEGLSVIILTDANSKVGLGHFYRCSAIASVFYEKKYPVQMLVNTLEEDLSIDSSFPVIKINWQYDRTKLFSFLSKEKIIIIDSYLANADLYFDIANKVKLSVYLDDTNRIEYPKGIVVNGAIAANEIKYPVIKGLYYLLGVSFLPLRSAFWEVKRKKMNNNIKSILVVMGGSDVRFLSPIISKFLSVICPDVQIRIVVNSLYKKINEINVSDNIVLITEPTVEILAKEMQQADIAISTAGQTLYELAVSSCPTIMIEVAENQVENIKAFASIGFIYLNYKDLSESKLKDALVEISLLDKRKKIISELNKKFKRNSLNNLVENIIQYY